MRCTAKVINIFSTHDYKTMTNKIKAIAMAFTLVAIAACSEQTPDEFQDITGVYLNNRSNTNILQDSTDVTFVYQKGDEMQVPVRVQLLGRTSDSAREIALIVSSDDAQEGIDYTLPEKAEMPAGTTTVDYMITLKRTASLKTMKKHVKVTLIANKQFSLPVTKETNANGDEVTTLTYTVAFSDQFTTAPKAWEDDLLGAFTQQKFELACRVLDIDPADFNDSSKMGLAMQSYISAEMQRYVREQQALRNSGEAYDAYAFDKQGNPLIFASE